MNIVHLIREKFRSWMWDPLAFCNDVFIEKPREWQPEAIEAVRKNSWTAFAACRKAGKTRFAAYITLWFLCTRANSLVVTIAPRWAQVEQAIWADIRYLWVTSKLPQIFPSWEILQTEIKTHPLTPKWRAMGLASNDEQNLEGRHPAAGQPALVILDESKGIADPFFDSVQGMLSDPESILLSIGTPGPPIGFFARAFARERKLWGFVKQIRADKIPRLARKCELERQRLGGDNPFFRQQQLAEFCGVEEGAAIPMDAIQRAIGRKVVWSPAWWRTAALDVGGKGNDRSVLGFRHGPVLLKQLDWQGWDEMKTAEHAARLVLAQPNLPGVFAVDEVGIGAGVRSRLQQLLRGSGIVVVGFNGGRAPKNKEQYANLKAEEVFYLRKRFIDNEISIPNHPDLISELCSWTTDYNSKGKTIIIDPEDSPDFADSCMMAFAADRLGQSVKGVTPSFLQ